MDQYRKNTAPFSHVLMANICLFVPPVFNFIIYSMKANPIHKDLLWLLCQTLARPWQAAQESLGSGNLAYPKCP